MQKYIPSVSNRSYGKSSNFSGTEKRDKFGDILANSGGRSLGLFDELTAFFSTMNMYSSVKMQISDTREYQDFLQMYTGKSKSRETSKLLLDSFYIFFKTIGSF